LLNNIEAMASFRQYNKDQNSHMTQKSFLSSIWKLLFLFQLLVRFGNTQVISELWEQQVYESNVLNDKGYAFYQLTVTEYYFDGS